MGRHAVVAGGAMGIGEAIARKLHGDGWSVTIIDRVAAQAFAVANDLGAGAFSECADITRPEQLAETAKAVRAHAGTNEILAAVNSVGVFDDRRPLLKTDLDGFNRMFNINVAGAFLFSLAFEPLLAPHASMVHISSVNGQLAGSHLGAYKVAKAGLNMLVRCLASELADDPRRIRVNAVSPGWVDTPGERRVQTAMGAGVCAFDDPKALQFIPMKRMIKAAEIAEAVAFLCSPAASAITGQILPVDCGITNSTV